MISIVIPTLNEEKFLPKLLDSLVGQTDKNFEVIVVDGKSRDKTVALARTYAKKLPKLNVLVSPKASLPLQRNIGAKRARGDWLAFVDADSVLMPYAIARMSAYIQDVNPRVFTTWCRPDSEVAGDALIILLWNITLESFIRFKRPLSPGPFTVVEKSAFDLVGGYDTDHTFNEDVDFSLRLHKKNIKLQILRETLYIVSLRRLRAQGALKVAQQYTQAALPVLFFNKSLNYMPGYIMGGHLYGKKKRPIASSVLKQYEKKFQNLLKELFE